MIARMLLVAALFSGASTALAVATSSEVVPMREPLAAFPMSITGWRGEPAPDFDDAIRAELGVDEYVNAIYTGPSHDAVGLYIGYYASQREGDTIHSPANCLPGGGWQPVESGHIRITVPSTSNRTMPDQPIEVTRWVIQRGDEQQLVLYWYQSHGRVVASEYWNKIYLVFDAVRLNRTDGALVRVVTPVAGSSASGVPTAEQIAVSFVRSMFPILERFLPV